MNDSITKEDFRRMIAGAAAEIRANHATLSELDCAAGDGDHGTTMLRAVDKLELAFAQDSADDLKVCLKQAGWSVLGVDGGARARCWASSLAEWLTPLETIWPKCSKPVLLRSGNRQKLNRETKR